MTWAHYANFRSLCGMESFIYMFHIYISVGYILSVLFLNYTAALNSSSGSSPPPTAAEPNVYPPALQKDLRPPLSKRISRTRPVKVARD